MRVFNGFGYLVLVALALLGLYRLYNAQASFSWALTIVYGVTALGMVVWNLVRYGYRKGTRDKTDDHKFDIVSRVWYVVALISTAYCAIAAVICYTVRDNGWLGSLYVTLAVACLVFAIVSFVVTRVVRRSIRQQFSPVV